MNDSTNSTAGRRRKSPPRALIAAGLVLIAAGGWYGVNKYRASKNAEGEYIYATISSGDIEDLVTSTGTLEPRDYVDVGAQVSGQIDKLNVEIGDVVKEGDVLATIDATTSEARVEGNKASLASSRASLETQKSNLEKAERDYKRQENLIKEDATTQEALANAKTTWINAQNQIRQSEAGIAQQIANMRIEEKNLQYTQIKAPISGTVMSIAVKQGQTVNASQQVPNVMRIANLSTMTVRAEVSEADVSKIYKDMPVYFTTLGGGSRRWPGTLKRREPTPKVQNSVVLYNALFDVANEGNPPPLMPSMTAQVFFVVAEARNVLTVPMAAIQQGQQISRQLAAKEREQKAAAGQATAGATPGGAPAAGAGATPAAGAAGASGSAPATAQANSAAPAAPGNAEAGQGNRAGNGGFGQGGNRPGGNGQRPGGGGGGGFGGFNGQMPTPEQMEQIRARMAANGGQGGFGRGNFGGMNGGGGGGGAAGPARQQRRNGTVMIKLADGKLEARKIVYGVTDRVHAQVIEGLKEGEEVVVGKREAAPAPGTATGTNNNQNNQNQNFRPNNFQGGGGNFRPF